MLTRPTHQLGLHAGLSYSTGIACLLHCKKTSPVGQQEDHDHGIKANGAFHYRAVKVRRDRRPGLLLRSLPSAVLPIPHCQFKLPLQRCIVCLACHHQLQTRLQPHLTSYIIAPPVPSSRSSRTNPNPAPDQPLHPSYSALEPLFPASHRCIFSCRLFLNKDSPTLQTPLSIMSSTLVGTRGRGGTSSNRDVLAAFAVCFS